ncbi:MAG: hypothetical protein H8E27_13090 [Verrucomicrobia subdivision 3 bacterium]|nr:hypothetical protein [Limisphaerales bacterium]
MSTPIFKNKYLQSQARAGEWAACVLNLQKTQTDDPPEKHIFCHISLNFRFFLNYSHHFAFSMLLALHLLRQHHCETRVLYKERCLGAEWPLLDLHFQRLQIFAMARNGGNGPTPGGA